MFGHTNGGTTFGVVFVSGCILETSVGGCFGGGYFRGWIIPRGVGRFFGCFISIKGPFGGVVSGAYGPIWGGGGGGEMV